MQLASEPSVAVKIQRMRERVRWGHPLLGAAGIDQTALALEGVPDGDAPFSFLVLGDSGTGRYRGDSPQRRVAELLLRHGEDARFLLHSGDVVYQVGSSEQYRANFIHPYREWLVGGEDWRTIAYDRMVFRRPFLPVPGNHDYYDLPLPLGILSGLSWPLRRLLRRFIVLDVGWHGSHQGQAYARAFLDVLAAVPEPELQAHLRSRYDGRLDGSPCLRYRPGAFTRLPNRYYRCRCAGVEVFALDSNTFNQPVSSVALADRLALQERRRRLEEERNGRIREVAMALMQAERKEGDEMRDDGEDRRQDLIASIEQIQEQIHDLDKQLGEGPGAHAVDREQLEWLVRSLVASWDNPAVRGRILLLHHPPYVTERTKWDQAQTLAVRHHLRAVLDRVAAALGSRPAGRPLVDLVLSGHAHCLEVLRGLDTGHGDAHIPWVICGGSGYSLRRQRSAGVELRESIDGRERPVARSELFVGRSGRGASLRRPYSALRVDVAEGRPLRLSLTPLVAEKLPGRRWQERALAPIAL
jgi:3',5'-cyclic AMP phosphodiesterase CpdA